MKGIITHKNTSFFYEIFMNPALQSQETKDYIINRFGDKIYKGQICLDNTKEKIENNINKNYYKAILFVKNLQINDEASASIQCYDWCNDSNPRLWINDVCRINNSDSKPSVSPVEILFNLTIKIAKSEGFKSVHLFVIENNNSQILTTIYKKYKFNIDNTCKMDGVLVMKRPVLQSGGRRTRSSKLRPVRN